MREAGRFLAFQQNESFRVTFYWTYNMLFEVLTVAVLRSAKIGIEVQVPFEHLSRSEN